MPFRDAKTVRSVADAYRSMYVKPNEDVLNEELIDALIEDVREEENLQEGTWAIPDSKDKLSALNRALSKPIMIKTEKDLDKASKVFGNLVGDDGVMDDWYKAFLDYEDVKKVSDAREPVVKFLKDWGVKLSGYKITHAPASWVSGMDDDERPSAKVEEIQETLTNKTFKQIMKLKGNLAKVKSKIAALKKKREKAVKLNAQAYSEASIYASKSHEDKISKVFKTKNPVEIKGIDRLIDMSSIGVVQSMQKQNPKGFKKTVMNLGKLKEEVESLDEVQKVEVDAMKKVSKDMQKVLKAYQAIANKGDKELKNTKHNFEYKQVLQARDTILSMIGKLETKMIIQQRNKKEGLEERVSGDDTPMSMMVHSKDLDVFKKLKVLASKAGVKLAKELKGIKVEGPLRSLIRFTELMDKEPSFKKEEIKLSINERVKDGKLDPLSKMGKSKLTGREITQYYRDNPKQKAAARDKSVKKAIELALDLGGATNYAVKEIEKFKKGLSKHPAVKLAIRHANESKEWTGHHVVIEALSSTNMIKLKAYGSQLAKITKLPFDDKNPEKGIDKLMGQIWQQKHSPANWERLHKMVAMLKGIGVKMPSLKGKYMGLDPVSKKAIFYKEDTNEIIEWHQKIDDIKEEIQDIVEAQEMKDADVKKIAQMTDRNDHNGSLMHLAKLIGDRKSLEALKGIIQTHKALGHMPKGLIDTRMAIFDDLMKQSKKKYRNHNDIYNAL